MGVTNSVTCRVIVVVVDVVVVVVGGGGGGGGTLNRGGPFDWTGKFGWAA